jgi:hypothetical protein
LAVTINLHPSAEQLAEALALIEAESFAGNEITPRPVVKLRAASGQGNLILVYSDGTLAGWGLIEPLTRTVSELGMTFVRPQFRNQPVFAAIVAAMDARPETLLMATYHPHLAAFTVKHRGFQYSSLGEFIRVSRGKFLFKRMNSAARSSIKTRRQTSQPIYVIRRSR